jgi:cation diffusion facilitator family transporter
MVGDQREKHFVALSSLIAACVLTLFKIVVGIVTGSLGILAEAAHSALDLLAALMTVFALRVADRPADRSHPYGHGKIESLSALFETVLLLVTCAWIVYSAITRVSTGELDIDVNIWAFIVILTSILVDTSRSKALYRAAKKFNSQALEADGLHFRTDIWSSSVVLFGLVCVVLGERYAALSFLRMADAIAAIVVALISVLISVRLGVRTIQALLDAAPMGLEETIVSTVEGIEGVANCHNVRVRYSGAKPFVDIHVLLNGEQTLREAHGLTEVIEQAVAGVLPEADVTVHPEPLPPSR